LGGNQRDRMITQEKRKKIRGPNVEKGGADPQGEVGEIYDHVRRTPSVCGVYVGGRFLRVGGVTRAAKK